MISASGNSQALKVDMSRVETLKLPKCGSSGLKADRTTHYYTKKMISKTFKWYSDSADLYYMNFQ